MNTRILAQLILGLFFSATTCCTFADAPPASTLLVGVVLATVGTVEIQRDTQKITAERKTALHVHDEIRTGDNARAQLRFADGTVTTLGGNTGFVIRQFDWSAGKKEQSSVQFALLTGTFRSVTGRALDVAGSDFGVTTPAGVIGIRGTDFWGGYLDGDAVDVLLIDGKHAVAVSNASGKVLLEKPGQGVTLKKDQSALTVKEWPQTKVGRAVATIAWPGGSTPPTE